MVVRVAFRNSPMLYDYLCDLPVKKGDLVVVPTGPAPFREFAVVKVMEVVEYSKKATSWVAQKVDVMGFNRKMKAIKEMEAMLE